MLDLSAFIRPGLPFKLGLLCGYEVVIVFPPKESATGYESLFFEEFQDSFSGVPGLCLGAL
eukprot:Gb_36300 [translate_table: standard]